MKFPMSFGEYFHFLLGLSLLFPAFSLLTIGRTTGIQPTLILAAICGALRFLTRSRRIEPKLLILLAIWFAGMVASVAGQGFASMHVNPMIVYCTNLAIIGFFAINPGDSNLNSFNDSLKTGFIAGALISAIYAAYQQIANVQGLPFSIPALNNPSYALYSDVEFIRNFRSYAFCPEPSVLAALLISSLCLVMSRLVYGIGSIPGNVGMIVVMLFGLLASGSFSLVISLPLALAAVFFGQLSNFRRWSRHLAIVASLIAISSLIILVWQPAQDQFLKVWDRASESVDDDSLIIRVGAMIGAVEMFKEYPLFGAGVIPKPDEFVQFLPVESLATEVARGVGSVGLGILMGHGLVGTLCYLVLMGWALKRSRQDPEINGALIGILVPMNIQVGYETIYALWVIIGLSYSLSKVQKEEGIRPMRTPTPDPVRSKRTPSLGSQF